MDKAQAMTTLGAQHSGRLDELHDRMYDHIAKLSDKVAQLRANTDRLLGVNDVDMEQPEEGSVAHGDVQKLEVRMSHAETYMRALEHEIERLLVL